MKFNCVQAREREDEAAFDEGWLGGKARQPPSQSVIVARSTMDLLHATLAEPQHFSVWEKLIFVALIVASAAGFWRRFGPIFKKILQSKKDPNFHLFPIGRRVWDFFWEVLCQAKVVRERPLPGL